MPKRWHYVNVVSLLLLWWSANWHNVKNLASFMIAHRMAQLGKPVSFVVAYLMAQRGKPAQFVVAARWRYEETGESPVVTLYGC